MAELTHFYNEENTNGTTTSSTWTNSAGTGNDPASIAGSSLEANTKYLIIARGLVGGNNASERFGMRVATADDSLVAAKSTHDIEVRQLGANDLNSYFFVYAYTTDASPADIEIQVRSEDGLNICFFDQTSLFLLDLDAIGVAGTDYFEDVNDTVEADEVEYDTGTANTILATIPGSSMGTDEYFVLGYASVAIGSTGRWYRHDLYGSYDTSPPQQILQFAQAEGEDVAELRLTGFASRHKANSGTPDATIYGQEEAANGNHFDNGAYLIAFPTSLFADFESVFNDNSVAVDGTETLLNSIASYAPTVTGNHLVIGRACGFNCTALGGMWVESGTTEIRTGDSVPTHNHLWDDAKDLEQMITFQRYSITSTETFNLRGQGAGADFDVQDRHLLVINLDDGVSAASVYPPFPHRNPATVRM